MKDSLFQKILWIIIFLILPSALCAAGLIPVGQPEYDFIYDRIERLETRALDYFDYQLGPYRDTLELWNIGPFDYLRNIPSDRLVLFGFAAEDFSAVKDERPQAFESFRGGFTANPVRNLYVYGNWLLDERKADDPSYPGKKWRGLAGGVEQAFVHYSSRSLEATFGRYASFWGPRQSLILAATNPLDGFGYTLHWGRLALSYRLAKLDGLVPERDSVASFENRYFAGHRLDFHFSKRLRVGLFETVIFGGPGRTIELNYLNPIIFFHSDQLNENTNDNTFLGFDFTWKPLTGLRLYGQVVVDDFQIEKKTQGDQEPDEYGVLMGAHAVELIDKTDFRLEYSRVTNRTFNQKLERNRYLLNNDLLGSAQGNDYDRWQADVIRWFNADLAVGAKLEYTRQGEGSVTDIWTEPWLDIEGDYREPFPTGVLEKRLRLAITAKGFVMNRFYFEFEGGSDRVTNFDNQSGDDRSLPFANFRISTFFSTSLPVD